MPAVEVILPGGVEAPPRARATVAAHLRTHLDPTRLDDLLLATSEVVTNAVLHGGGGPGQEVGLRLAREAGIVRIAVTDPTPATRPRLKARNPLEVGGLGLVVVEQLSERWGVERRGASTKAVWFEFLLTPPQLEPDLAPSAGRTHVACPDCGLRLYTSDAWTLLERCPRCQTVLARHRGSGHQA